MRRDNLLALRRRKFILTTNSKHDYPVALNLASRMTVGGVNQLWVADITYVRLREEHVYLAVVLDRFSRKAIGWAVERSLGTQLVVGPLKRAIARRQPPPGVVHHSGQGVQYASQEYVALLRAHRMTASMSRPAKPNDSPAIRQRYS